MAWAKIDDGWWAHPKVMSLSLASSGLWARALSWSCQQRRDVIPERFIAMVGADQEHADELVAAGLWHETEGGWRVHDWQDYQDRSLSEKRAEAGRKGGVRSGETRRQDTTTTKQTGSNVKQTGEANGEAGARPVPSRPNPSQGQERGSSKRAPETPLPDGWEPNTTHAKIAAEESVDLEREASKFRDHAKANDRRQRDWDAAFRTWLRRASEFGARASPTAVSSFASGAERF